MRTVGDRIETGWMNGLSQTHRMQTLIDMLLRQDAEAGTLSILDAAGEVVGSESWAVVRMRAHRIAGVLRGQGVGRGGRVGVCADSSLDLVSVIQGVWLCGAAVTVLPPRPPGGRNGRDDRLSALAADARFDLVVLDSRDAAGAVGPGQVRPVSIGGLLAQAAAAEPVTVDPPAPDDLAILQYTSGSTRSPRGVPVTHRHLAANLAAIRARLAPDRRPHRVLSWLPLHHDMGLVGFLTVPMAYGWPLLLQSPLAFAQRPAGWLEAISRHRVTASGGPNTAFALAQQRLAAGGELDLTGVRALLVGGEPVAAATMAQFAASARRHGLRPGALLPAYGLAEATLAVSMAAGARIDRVDAAALAGGHAAPARPGARARRLVRLGPPVPGTAVRVVARDTGEPLPARCVGEVEVRGSAVVGHYWGEPQPSAASWLRTGDLGYLTGAGAAAELVVCDRAKDVVIVCGRNIFPHDVEAVAVEAGARAGRVAAFGVAGEAGERLVVAIECRRGERADLSRQVTAAVRQELGVAPHTVFTLPLGGLPRTSSGKLRRSETRRQYLSGELNRNVERTSL